MVPVPASLISPDVFAPNTGVKITLLSQEAAAMFIPYPPFDRTIATEMILLSEVAVNLIPSDVFAFALVASIRFRLQPDTNSIPWPVFPEVSRTTREIVISVAFRPSSAFPVVAQRFHTQFRILFTTTP